MNRARVVALLHELAEEFAKPPICERCLERDAEAVVCVQMARDYLARSADRFTRLMPIRELSQETIDQLTGFDVVYFVQGNIGGLVKIGTTSQIAKRLKDLAAGSPIPLVVRAVIPGDAELESALHEEFREHRQHGEWFAPHPDLLARIVQYRGRL